MAGRQRVTPGGRRPTGLRRAYGTINQCSPTTLPMWAKNVIIGRRSRVIRGAVEVHHTNADRSASSRGRDSVARGLEPLQPIEPVRDDDKRSGTPPPPHHCGMRGRHHGDRLRLFLRCVVFATPAGSIIPA
jgi:hypothetical protein